MPRREVNRLLKLFVMAQNSWAALRDREEGQTMAEYGVVLAVITLGVILVLGFLSGAIEGAFQRVTDKLNAS